jgi:L-2,4-diaminobutyric acid acetyltransferase
MNYRKAEEKDIQPIVRLLNDCRPYVLAHHDYLYWILCNYYQSSCFVCEAQDRLIGFVSGLPSLDQMSVFIWQICVHPEYRRKGVACRLLQLLHEVSELNGFKHLQLSISKENSTSFRMFNRFADKNSLKMEFKKQVDISGTTESIYNICKL